MRKEVNVEKGGDANLPACSRHPIRIVKGKQ